MMPSSLAAVGGWGEFSNTEINKKLAGIQAEVATGVNDSGEMVSGSCAKKDFETMMQLTYLHFTAPRKDTEIYNSTIQRTKVALKNKEIDPMTALQDTINKVVYNDNPRAKRTKAEDLDRINYDRILEIYNERFADADDFDFFLIGDPDIDTIAPLLAKYLGALPTVKGKEKTKPTDLKIVSMVAWLSPPLAMKETRGRAKRKPTTEPKIHTRKENTRPWRRVSLAFSWSPAPRARATAAVMPVLRAMMRETKMNCIR